MACNCSRIAQGVSGLTRAAVAAVTGAGAADAHEIERRRSLCRECHHAIPCAHDPERKCVCKLCGCLLRAKTMLTDQSCPAGKW